MSESENPSQPPLLRLVEALVPALRKAHGADPVFLTAAEKRQALQGLHEGVQLLRSLELRVLGVAELGDDVCEDGGHRSVVDLHAHTTRSDRRTVARDHKLAVAPEQRWHALAAALQAGACTVAQADAIARALAQLPDDLPDQVLVRAEEYLVSQCAEFTPDQLRRLGRAVLEHVAPDVAEEEEARRLAAEEARARDAMHLHVRRNAGGIEGLSQLVLKAPDAIIDRCLTLLDAYTSPRHQAMTTDPDQAGEPTDSTAERLPFPRRRAIAFASLLESLDPQRLPLHGGDATTVLVTIPLDQLRAETGVGEVIGGDKLTAAEVRRLACTAKILPVVLGGKSEVLDLGRTKRLHSRPQRKALALLYRECCAEGCTTPATWCEAHHLKPWSQGGTTTIDDGRLLCPFHHHRAHDPRYTQTWITPALVRFTRRDT